MQMQMQEIRVLMLHFVLTNISNMNWMLRYLNNVFPSGDIVEEAKKQLWLAGPLIAVSLLLYSLQMISIMFVGHLGKLALSGASLGNSFASVIGYYSVLG